MLYKIDESQCYGALVHAHHKNSCQTFLHIEVPYFAGLLCLHLGPTDLCSIIKNPRSSGVCIKIATHHPDL